MTEEQRAARIKAALGDDEVAIPVHYDVTAEVKPTIAPLKIRQKKDESWEEAKARAAMSPVYTGSLTARRFASLEEELDTNAAVAAVYAVIERVRSNEMHDMENILVAQAIALNCVFTQMAGRASANMNTNLEKTEAFMRMALRAQANCRATIETLAEVKNPRTTNFVRQQNNAHQQQVNNGVSMTESAARAPASKKTNVRNELLEVQDGERLDTRAESTTGGADQNVATVEQVHRAKDTRRQGSVPRKRAAARA